MHVLVTGGSGLCGRHVAARLLAAGHRVSVVVGRAPGTGAPPDLAGAADLLYCDLAAEPVLPRSLDAVVHAAARLPDPEVGPADLTRDNVAATRRLVEAAQAAGAATFLYFSSLSVYGRISGATVSEETPVDGPEPYGASKLAGEELVRSVTGFRSLALRLPGIIGPRSTRNWLSRVMAAARAGEDVTVFNPATPFNNAVHVGDLARFVVRLLEGRWDGADVVTLGAAGMTTAGEAARIVIDGLGGRSRIVPRDVPGAPGFTVSSGRAVALYGYDPMAIGPMLERFAAENAPN